MQLVLEPLVGYPLYISLVVSADSPTVVPLGIRLPLRPLEVMHELHDGERTARVPSDSVSRVSVVVEIQLKVRPSSFFCELEML